MISSRPFLFTIQLLLLSIKFSETFHLRNISDGSFRHGIVQKYNFINIPTHIKYFHTKSKHSSLIAFLNSVPDDNLDEDDEDDDDDYDVELGDWRQFRMNLAATTSTSSLSSSSSRKTKRPKTVSRKNEELLQSQNKELANEYLSGIWAHEVSEPEVGGLVCRLPLEAEIWRSKTRSGIGRKLQDSLTSDESKPGAWYKAAQNLIEKELKKMADKAQNGKIDPRDLKPDAMELLRMVAENQENWQQVGLILERSTSTKVVTINRPLSLKLSEDLAKFLLFGKYYNKVGVSQTETLVKFLNAFENECGVYMGGPNGQDHPAEIIHGIPNLEGCVEIGEGTGIYMGGIPAAIESVLKGHHEPLEFRFIVGYQNFTSAILEEKVKMGKYQPIACARSLALKQCIGLPKPLWNEVMELCGGELKEISSLELTKRSDIDDEEKQVEEEEEEEEEELGNNDDNDELLEGFL